MGLFSSLNSSPESRIKRSFSKGKAVRKAKGKAVRRAKGKAVRKAKGKAVRRAKGKAVRKAKGKAVRKAKGKVVRKATKGKSRTPAKRTQKFGGTARTNWTQGYNPNWVMPARPSEPRDMSVTGAIGYPTLETETNY